MTQTKLVIGDEEYWLAEDADVEALKATVLAAIRAGGGYVPIVTNGSRPASSVFLSSEIAHRFEEIGDGEEYDDGSGFFAIVPGPSGNRSPH